MGDVKAVKSRWLFEEGKRRELGLHTALPVSQALEFATVAIDSRDIYNLMETQFFLPGFWTAGRAQGEWRVEVETAETSFSKCFNPSGQLDLSSIAWTLVAAWGKAGRGSNEGLSQSIK